jgi:hypothetical protein
MPGRQTNTWTQTAHCHYEWAPSFHFIANYWHVLRYTAYDTVTTAVHSYYKNKQRYRQINTMEASRPWMVTVLIRNWLSKHLETTAKPRNNHYQLLISWVFEGSLKLQKRLVTSMLMILSHFRLTLLYPFRCSIWYSHTEWQPSWPHGNWRVMAILNGSCSRSADLFRFPYHQGFNDSRRLCSLVLWTWKTTKLQKSTNPYDTSSHLRNRLTGEFSSHGRWKESTCDHVDLRVDLSGGLCCGFLTKSRWHDRTFERVSGRITGSLISSIVIAQRNAEGESSSSSSERLLSFLTEDDGISYAHRRMKYFWNEICESGRKHP